MALADRLGGEEEVARSEGWASDGVSVGGHFGGSGEQDEEGLLQSPRRAWGFLRGGLW